MSLNDIEKSAPVPRDELRAVCANMDPFKDVHVRPTMLLALLAEADADRAEVARLRQEVVERLRAHEEDSQQDGAEQERLEVAIAERDAENEKLRETNARLNRRTQEREHELAQVQRRAWINVPPEIERLEAEVARLKAELADRPTREDIITLLEGAVVTCEGAECIDEDDEIVAAAIEVARLKAEVERLRELEAAVRGHLANCGECADCIGEMERMGDGNAQVIARAARQGGK